MDILQELISFVKSNPEFTAGVVVAATMGYRGYRKLKEDSNVDDLNSDQEVFRKSLISEIDNLKSINDNLNKDVIHLTEKLVRYESNYNNLIKNVSILRKLLKACFNDEKVNKTIDTFLSLDNTEQDLNDS